MLDWLKIINKDYPDFWKNYLKSFEAKPDRFVILNTKRSGETIGKDVIFEIGAVAVIKDKIIVGDHFEAVLLQYKFLHDNNLSNEFLIESNLPKMAEPQAVENFVDFLGNSVLVGHNIHYDVELFNDALERLHCGRLKNEALDIEIMHKKLNDLGDKPVSLDEMVRFYKLPAVDRATAVDDAYAIALLFLKLKSRLGIK